MTKPIIKTTTFRDHPGCKVLLEEMQDGQKFIRKSCRDKVTTDKEWDALNYLHSAGINVPELYRNNEHGMYMQYIDGGMLWDSYQTADADCQQDLIEKFTKLLFDLHNVPPRDKPSFGSFIQNELAEIKVIMEKKQLDEYNKIHSKLTDLSVNIKETPPCYIHRDYHVWNVLFDSNQKLYLIDMELTQGDSRFDVGWTYMLQKRSAVHDPRHGEIAQSFLESYYQLNPEANIDIEFFMQLANLRWLVNVAPENKTDNHWFPEMRDIAEQDIKDFLQGNYPVT